MPTEKFLFSSCLTVIGGDVYSYNWFSFSLINIYKKYILIVFLWVNNTISNRFSGFQIYREWPKNNRLSKNLNPIIIISHIILYIRKKNITLAVNDLVLLLFLSKFSIVDEFVRINAIWNFKNKDITTNATASII